MSNSYYNHATYPAPNSPGSSVQMRNELGSITTGFNKLPVLALANAYKVAMVGPSGDILQASSSLRNLALTLSTIDSTPIGTTTTSTGGFTNLTVSGIAQLGNTVTIGGGTINNTLIGNTTPVAGYFTTLSATGGLTGNVAGNLTGNVTGNVTGNLTGNVTALTGSSTLNNVTITGTLDMSAGTVGTITGLSEPSGNTDAATKNYVDSGLALKLNLAGGTLTGALAMSNNKITGLATPTATADAANKGYVDTSIANLVDSAPGTLDTLNELAAALADDPNFATTMTTALGTKLALTGGTMSGAIAMGNNKITGLATPSLGQDATNKSYVDTNCALLLPLTGGTMSGAISMGTNKITGLGNPGLAQDAATKSYVDTLDALKLSLTGGTMSGAIAMGANKITGLGDPAASQDAATKNYVDGIMGSATAAATSASNAAASEANALTYKTAAYASQQAAATSEANAAASYDHFDDRYLGAKASDPSTDNDGNALLVGALYWNTSSNNMKVWSGAVWEQSYLPASGYQPLDADLTAIAGISESSGLLKKTGANTWVLDTNSYLTGFTETDPVFMASPAAGIESADISAWDTAYGWSDHSSAGYLTASSASSTYLALSGGALTGALKEAKVALSANDINLSSGNYFTKTISTATTLTVSNVPATGTAVSLILDLTNGGAGTITWWSGMKWAGGTAPTLTASGRDVLGFFTHDGGTTWTGLVLGKDVK